MPKEAQLHELLAVEGDLKGKCEMVLNEAKVTFAKKPHLFTGELKVYEPFDEKDKNTATTEKTVVDTTVAEKLAYVGKSVINYLDAFVQKEATNQDAKADVVISGTSILKDVPATALLGLESKIKKIRETFEMIPTLAPGLIWVNDDSGKVGVFRTSEPSIKFKTKKVPQHKILYEATDKHRAEIEKWDEDTKVGRIETTSYSGMVSPADKAALLERIDKLIQAVKKARQKANKAIIQDVHIGKTIMEYIIG